MKIELLNPAFRRDWKNSKSATGLLLEKDIGIGHGKLKAKLMVFKTTRDLRKFWSEGLGSQFNLGRYCRGAVNGLFQEVIKFEKGKPEKHSLRCDPRYFCVIGLVKGWLSMEVICHESIHAAFNFVKRKSRSPWDVQAKDLDEEAVCYPAGRIAARINRVLHAAKLYA